MVYAIPPLLRKQLEFKELTSGQTFHFQCLEVFSELVEVPLHFIVVPPPQVKSWGRVTWQGRSPLGNLRFRFFLRRREGGWRWCFCWDLDWLSTWPPIACTKLGIVPLLSSLYYSLLVPIISPLDYSSSKEVQTKVLMDRQMSSKKH